MRLEDIQPYASVRGILPDAAVTVVNVEWHGSAAESMIPIHNERRGGGALAIETGTGTKIRYRNNAPARKANDSMRFCTNVRDIAFAFSSARIYLEGRFGQKFTVLTCFPF
jgi:hypothetical protein